MPFDHREVLSYHLKMVESAKRNTIEAAQWSSHNARPRNTVKGWYYILSLLTKANIYSWTKEITDVVLEASNSIPGDTELGRVNLIRGSHVWYFEKPLAIRAKSSDGVWSHIKGIAFGWEPVPGYEHRGQVFTTAVFDDGPHMSFVWSWGSEEEARGTTLKEVIEDVHNIVNGELGMHHDEESIASTLAVSKLILAGCVWLEQKILHEDPIIAERFRRRQFERETKQEAPAIRIVHLRRSEHVTYGPSKSEDESNREYSCRWIVSGHWRNQPYGLKKLERKLKFIHPYVKGPDDKPIRTRPTVMAVDR